MNGRRTRGRAGIFKNLFTDGEIFFVSLSPLPIFLNERSRAANVGLSRFRKLRGARPPPGPSLGSFHVAGNFTVIYDGGMNPRPRVEQGENARTSPRPGLVASILLIRYD